MIKATFTLFKGKPAVSKAYDLEDGVLKKLPAENFFKGKYETKSADHAELEALIKTLKPGHFITYGVNKASPSGNGGRTLLKDGQGDLSIPEGPGLLILDGDYLDNPEYEITTPEDYISKIRELDQALQNVAIVSSSSASSYVYVDGVLKKGLGGLHNYIVIDDARAIPTVVETLHKRSVLAGYAHWQIAENGKVHIKSLVDLAFKTANQPCYEGGSRMLNKSITQKPFLGLFPGGFLVAADIKPLSADEEQAYLKRCEEIRFQQEPVAAEIRAIWQAKREQEAIDNGATPEEAKLVVERQLKGDLFGECVIHTDSHGRVTVSEILSNRKKYYLATCAAPSEPIYGQNKAIIYSMQDKPVIHSMAHGESKTYFLHPSIALEFIGSESIPGLDERPTYKVFDSWVEYRGTSYKPGAWYFGIKRKDNELPELTETFICSPLYVEAVTADAYESGFGRKLRYVNTLGTWRTWAMPMSLLAGSGEELRAALFDMGVAIDPHGRTHLASYLQSVTPKETVRCAKSVGWCDGNFVLPDTVIGPTSSSVIFQSGTNGHHEYTQAGSLDAWKAGVAAPAESNPLLALALCVAFSGPLLALCNKREGGGVHFYGDSSTGKTTLIEAACSVWGGPRYKRSWRATSNGLEGAAALFNDNLLALDEISECDPKEVGAIVYFLGNGTIKQRATITGSARGINQWRCVVLSSGERTVSTSMAESGKKAKAGQAVRLLDIPACRKFGAWDDLSGHESGAGFSNAIKSCAATNHGYAGREFLARLTSDTRDFPAMLEAYKKMECFNVAGGEGQEARAGERFALFAMAGELATEYGITGWNKPCEAAINAAAVGFKLWRDQRGKGNDERRKIIEQVAAFIDRHADSRFSKRHVVDSFDQVTVYHRAGWYENLPDVDLDGADGGRIYLLTPDGMHEALHGFEFSSALKVLAACGALVGGGGKNTKPVRVNGATKQLYHIYPTKLSIE